MTQPNLHTSILEAAGGVEPTSVRFGRTDAHPDPWGLPAGDAVAYSSVRETLESCDPIWELDAYEFPPMIAWTATHIVVSRNHHGQGYLDLVALPATPDSAAKFTHHT